MGGHNGKATDWSNLAVQVTAIFIDELEKVLRLHRFAQDVVNADLQSPKLHIIIERLVRADGHPRVMQDLGWQAAGVIEVGVLFVATRLENAFIRPALLVFNLSDQLVSLIGIHLLDGLMKVPAVVWHSYFQLEQNQLNRVQAASSLFTEWLIFWR